MTNTYKILVGKLERNRATWENLSVDGKMILRSASMQYDMRVWTNRFGVTVEVLFVPNSVFF